YRLRKLDPENPVLFIVGTPESGKIIHEIPMLSCQKATDIDEVLKWSQGNDLLIDYKVDGLSLSLTYLDGHLIQAATRGNGVAGDDTSVNVMKLTSIPKNIPINDRLFVRGELFMRISEFNRINSLLPDTYSSPRNLAVGTIKQKDLRLLEKRNLEFFAFELLGFQDTSTFVEKNDTLKSWGFKTATISSLTVPSREEITSIYQEIEKKREDLDFEIDGLVLKFNESKAREEAGTTAHHPKWMIALKFKSKGKPTKINEITWQVGRTGVITPVAELEPVEISGAEIKRATLHNRDFVETLGVAEGDIVMVIRSGDVIPKITRIEEKGPNIVKYPSKCPSCEFPLEEDGVNLICTSKECKERDIQKIRHWIRITEINGLGPKNVEKLYDKGLVTHFSDLYNENITETELIRLFGKNGAKVHENIQATRKIPYHLFLAGLGIENLGKQMAKVLTKSFNSWKDLIQATPNQLTSIEGISDLTAGYIIRGLNDPSLGLSLLEKGVEIVYESRKNIKSRKSKSSLLDFIGSESVRADPGVTSTPKSIVTQRSVYVSGKIPEMTKKQVKTLLRENGYEWAPLTKKLDLLILGEKAGVKKIEKARKYGVTIKRWEDFKAEIE
ncbi:MAG: NAD-dependent DNA ligase LigA, partial [Candidatus Hodarchaeales archaeon]